ncbi:MAG: Rhomboid family protein [Verrucomicrobia bacterium]|nr:Rhomboid family protein [Verrucomicrobiota bacterium]
MLSDRPYMRDSSSPERASVLTWLVSAVIAGFILQIVAGRVFQSPGAVEHLFGLSRRGIRAGFLWSFFSYSFLHDTNNLLHIVGNLLGLYFIGRVLQPMLGGRRFLAVYAAAVIVGGLVWSAVNWHVGGTLVGASAGVFGLFVIFACFYPHQPVTFLLLFIVPVTLKPKHVAIAAALIDLTGCLFYEVMGAVSPFGFAHSAHLGGMAVGWLYFRYLHEANWQLLSRRPEIELPRWAKKSPKAAEAATYQVNVGPKADLRAEVDRILDKINSQGFGALTADEKRLLDDAKDLLSRQ